MSQGKEDGSRVDKGFGVSTPDRGARKKGPCRLVGSRQRGRRVGVEGVGTLGRDEGQRGESRRRLSGPGTSTGATCLKGDDPNPVREPPADTPGVNEVP